MTTINGKVCVVNGTPVDKVFSNGKHVYGRNLLTNTSDFSSNWIGMSSVSTTTEYNGQPSMVFASSSQWLVNQRIGEKLENSFQYTSSFWAKADNAGDKAHTELWGSNGATDFVLTTNWVRYAAVLSGSSGFPYCYFGVPDGNKRNVYIALPKLEKGSIATPWSPAPEDVLKGYIAAPMNLTATVIDAISEKLDWE